jgi:L-ribulose-5-phosphate 3-epimerase
MNSIPRRTFLKHTFGAMGAACILRAGAGPTKAAATAATGGFRIFACDWTLQQSCNPEAFALAARIGLDGVQVEFGRNAEGSGPLPLFAPAKQDELMAAAARHAVPIVSLAMSAIARYPYKRDSEAEQWVLDSIAVLQRMRLPLALLAFFGNGDLVDDAAGVAEVIRRFKRLAPRAEAAGVVFGIESWLKVPELERILDAVNSPAIQVYYDVGNMQKVGEDVGAAIRRLGRERICEVHLKDYDDLYGKGSMNFPAVRSALDAIGYRGWVGIEGTRTPLGVEQSIRYDLEYLRPIFPSAGISW